MLSTLAGIIGCYHREADRIVIIFLLLVPVLSSAQGFVDVTAQSGIAALHDGNLQSDTLHIGSGGGWIDANADGRPDIYLTKRLSANLLYINNGNGSFAESASTFGVQDASGDGAGMAVADFNNDGYDDLFLVNSDACKLFQNNGGNGFVNITFSAGIDTTDQSRSTSAAWADYNSDGFVDLYITNHIPVAGYTNATTADKLYKNNGNNTFTDVSFLLDATGILTGSGTNALWTDYDNDKDVDLIVINDCSTGNAVPNQFYRNDGNTHPTLEWNFTEVGVSMGLAECNRSYGVSSGDYNNDGWIDLFISGQGECFLMKNNSGTVFMDVTASALISGIVSSAKGWATLFTDVNLDGWPDLMMTQGSWNTTSLADPQPNMFFLNTGTGTFVNSGAVQNLSDVSKTRNVMFADYDLDGDPDMLIVNYGEQAILKKNENHDGNHFVALRLTGVESNRNCIGARVRLTLPGNVQKYLELGGSFGFGGTSSSIAFIGIGIHTKATALQITWPTGIVQTLQNIPSDRLISLEEPGSLSTTVSYTNVAAALGIDIGCGECNPGGGVSFADFNNDGWDDLTFCTEAGDSVVFYKNNQNGTFTKLPSLVPNTTFQRSATWVDYDNDGDKDLYLSNFNAVNRLYKNNGNLVLTDVTFAAGLPNINDPSYSSHFGDANNDGWLDIYVVNWPAGPPATSDQHTNYLYLSDGDGTFTNMTTTYQCSNSPNGMPPGYVGLASAFLDINEDGLQDIYVSNDRYFFPNVMYKNLGSVYSNISVSSGTNDTINAMNVGVGDYDNDGDMDIYVTNTGDTINPQIPNGGNIMYRNNGNETFTDVAHDLGLQFFEFGWGANFLDCDLDLDQDLYVCAQNIGPENGNKLYLNDIANDTFVVAVVPDMVGDTTHSFSNAIGDLNNDGFPDIAVNNATPIPLSVPDLDLKFHVWQNETQTPNRWLNLRLRGTIANRDGIGSWISYYINGQKYIRYTYCGEAYLAQNSNTVFFGMGSNLMVDSIVVKWLSGNKSKLYNVLSNQTLVIDESTVIYVAHDAQGFNTGMSWTNAFKSLKDALDYTKVNTQIHQIWVKTGTYQPHATDRYVSFEISQGVEIYGGFAGSETLLTQRNPVLYPVTLNGDIGTPVSTADNSYHVVSVPGTVTSSLIDGVIIKSGNANGPNAALQRGGGVHSSGTVILKGVQITNCMAATVGSAIYHSGMLRILTLDGVTLSQNVSPGSSVNSSGNALVRWKGMNAVQD